MRPGPPAKQLVPPKQPKQLEQPGRHPWSGLRQLERPEPRRPGRAPEPASAPARGVPASWALRPLRASPVP
jgi:hypothetical protein